MRKLFVALMVCGLTLMPHTTYAYASGTAGSGGATEVSYTASNTVITNPVEPGSIPKTGDMSHEITGNLFMISGALLIIMIILYKRKKEEEYE